MKDTRTTFNVKVWNNRPLKRATGTHYQARWFLDGQEFNQTFTKAKAADSHRSMLVAAVGKGEAFAFITGLPLSHDKTAEALAEPAVKMQSAFDLATAFVDRKWDDAAATYRVDIAKAMMAFTVAMLTETPPARITGPMVRAALKNWQFTVTQRKNMPKSVAAIIDWVCEHTRPVADLNNADTFEEIFSKIVRKLDGKPMAESSYKRYRAIMNSFLAYSVRLKQLDANPLAAMEISDSKASRPTKAIVPVDKRRLTDQATAEALLSAVRRTSGNGEVLELAMEVMYRAGPRPEEIVALEVGDFIRAKTAGGWGELVLYEAAPETAKRWTDDGSRRQRRGLKGRARGERRRVPVHPVLERRLSDYIANKKLRPGQRMFSGLRGGELAYSVLDKALKRARREVLSEEQVASTLAKTLYDWRHLCLTNWLNRGIPPANVASWAGNSVPVLLATYVNVIDNEAVLRGLLDRMYDPLSGADGAGTPSADPGGG
ncbi:tyrosine-type recombinase/integrase [Catenulispora pinisilvae]|uniref:tyrosine-type recombinase/integrase n=1 Tax=Catenulispora pinisilvae TaxID=2705253 RepID=UPI001891E8A2|nr:site-specific integrase [Catenulispora pinisilvae]